MLPVAPECVGACRARRYFALLCCFSLTRQRSRSATPPPGAAGSSTCRCLRLFLLLEAAVVVEPPALSLTCSDILLSAHGPMSLVNSPARASDPRRSSILHVGGTNRSFAACIAETGLRLRTCSAVFLEIMLLSPMACMADAHAVKCTSVTCPASGSTMRTGHHKRTCCTSSC